MLTCASALERERGRFESHVWLEVRHFEAHTKEKRKTNRNMKVLGGTF